MNFSLALRNLLRNRRRSLTTLAAMAIGITTVLLFGGYSRDITYALQTQTVRAIGHLQIQHQDYFLYGTGNPAAYGIASYASVIRTIRNDPVLAPMVTVVTPRLTFGGLAGNFAAGVSRTIIGSGVVADDLSRLREWDDYHYMKRFNLKPPALSGAAADAAVVGIGVARVLQLCAPLEVPDCPQPSARPAADGAPIADDIAALAEEAAGTQARPKGATRIELLASNVHGAPNVASLQVVRAENQGVKELDDMYIGLHLAQAQRLVYGADTPRATAIVVQLAHTSQIPAASDRLRELLAAGLSPEPLVIRDFETLNPFYRQAIAMFASIFGFISVLITTIVLFTVGNTMSAAIVERTTEIGTLRAVGLRRAGVRRLFVWEGFLLGVIGAVIGVVAALLIAWGINHSGLTWLPPGQAVRIPITVRVWGEPDLILGTAAGLACVAMLSAWWPARRAARMNIVDALRHV